MVLAIDPDSRATWTCRLPHRVARRERAAPGVVVAEPGRWQELDGYTDRPDEAHRRARRTGARRLRGGRRGRVRARGRHCVPDMPGPTDRGRRDDDRERAREGRAARCAGQRVVHDASTFTLVRVVTDEGVEGFGEVSATAAWSGEDAVTATHFVRDVLGPALIGKPLAPIAAHATEFDRVLRGNWFTKAGVATRAVGCARPNAGRHGGRAARRAVPARGAGEDLAQRRRRRPARRLRDGVRPRLPVLQGQGRPRPGRRRGAGSRSRASSPATTRFSARTPTAAGRFPSRSRRSRVSPSRDRVHRAAGRTPDDLEGLREVRALGVPLVADESVYSPADVAPDRPHRGGGRRQRLRRQELCASSAPSNRARLARELGLDVVIGANGEMGIGAAAQLHVACACEHLERDPARDHRAPLLRGGRLARRAARHRRPRRAAPGRAWARRRAERRGAAELHVSAGVQVFVYPEELEHVEPEALAAQVLELGCDAASRRGRLPPRPSRLPAPPARERADADDDVPRARARPLRRTRPGRRAHRAGCCGFARRANGAGCGSERGSSGSTTTSLRPRSRTRPRDCSTARPRATASVRPRPRRSSTSPRSRATSPHSSSRSTSTSRRRSIPPGSPPTR